MLIEYRNGTLTVYSLGEMEMGKKRREEERKNRWEGEGGLKCAIIANAFLSPPPLFGFCRRGGWSKYPKFELNLESGI